MRAVASGRFAGHLISAVLVVVLFAVSAYFWPILVKTVGDKFSFVSDALGLYGVVFAVLELWRTQDAAKLAQRAAEDVKKQIEKINDIRSALDCISLIESALYEADQVGFIGSVCLSRIVKLYRAEFHDEVRDSGSIFAQRAVLLQSFALKAQNPKERFHSATRKLKLTLLDMHSDLSGSANDKTRTSVLI